MKTKLIFTWSLLVLTLFNLQVWQKEWELDSGREVILELAPRDPRSLMQGDYMVLNYALIQDLHPIPEQDGSLVLRDDKNGVAKFVGYHDGTPLTDGSFLLKYQVRRDQIKIGAESFFFQEGQGRFFEDARYGKLVVTQKGDAILSGLLNKALEPMTYQEPKPGETSD